MAASITFYTNPMSRGQIARWALHEAGAEYEEVLLDYTSTMKTPDYLAINPMGKVPAIVHEGRVVTEAAAICLYLADAFPDAGLKPETLDGLATYYRWTVFGAGPVEQAIIAHSMKWDSALDDDRRMQATVGFGSYERTVDALATALSGGPYLCGSQFTAADIYVGAQVDWGMQFGTLPERAEFTAYAARIREREAYKAAKAIDAGHIASMQQSDG